MSDLIVCTYCDQRSGMLDEYAAQLQAAGIDFHVQHIAPFPNPVVLPFTFKAHWLRELANHFRAYQKMVFTDGWDVLFFGTHEVVDLIPDEVVWAAERNCWPDAHLSEQFPGNTPWRYVNAGMMSGAPEAILDWVADTERHPAPDKHALEQQWLNRRRLDTPGLVKIDDTTKTFYVVSGEDHELQSKDGRLWNSLCDTYPCWFHFSGHLPTDFVRNLLTAK